MIRLSLGGLAAAALSLTGQAQNLLEVDDGFVNPTYPQFADIPAAVAAAVDGEHIVVHDGDYSGFTIDNKKVSIYVPRGASSVNLSGPVQVQNLDDDQWVVLRGFNSAVSTTTDHLLQDNEGAVWIEDCAFASPTNGLHVDDCWQVTLVRCQFQAGPGSGGAGGSGLLVDGLAATPHTTMSVWDCEAYGGSPTGAGLDGGPGAHVGDDVTMFSSGSFYTGGDGSDGATGACTDGGDGGDGLELDGSSSSLEYLGLPSSTAYFVGGSGGGATSPCSPGANGTALQVTAGSATNLSHEPRSLVVQAAVPGGGTIQFNVTGLAGDDFYVYGDTQPIQVPASSPHVGHLVAAPVFDGPTGTLGMSGTAQSTMTVTPLNPGESAIAFAQTWHFPGGGSTVVLSAPSTIILLN